MFAFHDQTKYRCYLWDENHIVILLLLDSDPNHKSICQENMGASFSEPVAPATTLGMFCIMLIPLNKLSLLHAPKDVIDVVRHVVNQINGRVNPVKIRMGAVQFKMVGLVFTTNKGKELATKGKLLCIRLLEELYKIGYELDLSSDLARSSWQASTLFFRKTTCEQPEVRVMCVAPGKIDRITLLNHDERSMNAVKEAIKDTWPKGIRHMASTSVVGQTIYEINMNGSPWLTSDANIDNNRIINRIVGNLSQLNIRLVAGINIKGDTDSLFFISDPSSSLQRPHFASISLCRADRLRLVDCKDEADAIRQAIDQNSAGSLLRIQEESLRVHHAKFKLLGTPWRSSGMEAIRARQLVSRISEVMLQRGWALTDALDMSKKSDDKSMLLFRRCAPTFGRFSCFALTSINQLTLIDFPSGDLAVLKNCLTLNYLPGIQKLESSDEGNLRATLSGFPWSHPAGLNLGWALHARSLVLHLLATLIRLGYRLVVSADVSARYARKSNNHDSSSYPLDVDTIYLVKLDVAATEGGVEQPPSYLASTMFD